MNKILSILILALAALTANAQDDFNPTLPGEPNAQYKVTVGISHSAAGTVSGGGSFSAGRQVTISRNDAYFSSSSTTFYKFKCWTLNGVEYTPAGQDYSFTYTVSTQNAEFEAVYEEENPDKVTSRLYLVADPADACTFNMNSGQRHLEGNSVYLYYYETSNAFKFKGWYEGDKLISTNKYFYYTIGKNDALITARFTYEPSIPGEPNGDQEDVDNELIGDVNNDGIVDMRDAVACVDAIVSGTSNKIADINNDGKIDEQDVLIVINNYLNSK